jgi:phosphatidylethanolamine/phosphatidyl-N-methylethanolamine N-methyltransferase
MPHSRSRSVRFLKAFLANPLAVGSVIPSSKRLAQRMLESHRFETAQLVVEVGAGTGAVTHVILDNLPLRADYLGIDLNVDFIIDLKKRYPQGRFFAESVENLPLLLEKENLKKADYIVSGLPWTLFSDELQNTFLAALHESMEDNGELVTFVYLPVLYSPLGRRFLRNLRKYFIDAEKRQIEFWNFPSAAVIRVRKRRESIPDDSASQSPS